MIGIRNKEQVQRAQAFEDIINTTAVVLEAPEVSQQLGILGVDLALMNRNAFLPNIKNGKISLPKEYVESDEIAVVPLTQDEARQGIALSEEILRPTPQRRHKIEKQIESTSDFAMSAEGFITGLTRASLAERPIAKPPLSSGIPASTLWGYFAQPGYPFFNLRPVVYIDQALPRVDSRQTTAVVPHEYLHAYDREALDRLPDNPLQYTAYEELRAYFVSRVILKFLKFEGYQSLPVAKVDRLRRLFSVGIPLNPHQSLPPSLVKSMQKDNLLGIEEEIGFSS